MNNSIKKAIQIILTFFIVLCIHFRPEVITDGLPANSTIGFIFMQLSVAFSSVSLSDIFSFIAIYILLKYVDDCSLPNNILYGVLSFILAVTYVLCQSYYHFNGLDLITASKFQLIYSFIVIIGFTILLYQSIRYIAYILTSKDFYNNDNPSYVDNNFKDLWKKLTIAMIVCWIPWLLCDYPGTFNSDATYTLQQFFGYEPLAAISPPFSTLIIGTLVLIGKTLINVNFGVFLYLLFHSIISATIYSYVLIKFLSMGINKKVVKLFACYFCFLPLWGIYMEWFEKDPLYAAIVVLFTVYLLDVLKNKECTRNDAIKLILTGLAVTLLRHNGYYTIIPTLIVFCFYLKKNSRKLIIATTLVVFIVFKLLSNVVYPAIGFTPVSSQAYMVVPFQMTARYVYSYGDYVTAEEKEAISGVLDYDHIAENYNPIIADDVHRLYTEDISAVPAYLKQFVKMGLKHPNIYFSAFINNNFGYLAPVCAHIGIYMNYGESEWESQFGINHIFNEMPVRIFDCIKEGSDHWPILQYFNMGGTYTWILLVLLSILFSNKKYSSMLLFVPAFFTFAFCIVSPCATELRYMLPNVASLPLLVCWTIYSLSSNPENQKEESV